jgi:hypothetical protein
VLPVRGNRRPGSAARPSSGTARQLAGLAAVGPGHRARPERPGADRNDGRKAWSIAQSTTLQHRELRGRHAAEIIVGGAAWPKC